MAASSGCQGPGCCLWFGEESPVGSAYGKSLLWGRRTGMGFPGTSRSFISQAGSPQISGLGAQVVCGSHQGLHPW